jgi:hypothetical protein
MNFPQSPKKFMMEFFCHNLKFLFELIPAVMKDVDLVIKDRVNIERPILSQRLIDDVKYVEADEPLVHLRVLDEARDPEL